MTFTERVRPYLDDLSTRLEEAGVDVDLNDLTLSFAIEGEALLYLVKVHQITEELWVSSPLSGGQRFAWDPTAQKWLNIRTQEEFEKTLWEELASKKGAAQNASP